MNSQLRKRLLFGGGALITIITVGVLTSRTPSFVSETAKTDSPSAPIEITKANENSVADNKPNEATASTQAPAEAEKNSVLKPFESKTELAEFKILKQKVFLTEEEKAQRKIFLQDRALLENLKSLFKYPAQYQDLENQQNVAVDLLLEAIKSGDADTARAVFKELIADPTIENKQLTPSQRQNLAGVKAEVLYQWSSLEPDRASEMQSALPGPVSQKIWKNIERQQQNNEAESAITK